MELKEYATEVDVEFVRKAVRAIGRCAIKIEPAAKRCVRSLDYFSRIFATHSNVGLFPIAGWRVVGFNQYQGQLCGTRGYCGHS